MKTSLAESLDLNLTEWVHIYEASVHGFFFSNKSFCCCSRLVQAVLYERAPILPVLQKHTVFSLHVRSLSSPEISQRASSSSFTLKHPAHCATPAAYVHNKHSLLPQQRLRRHLHFYIPFPTHWRLHTCMFLCFSHFFLDHWSISPTLIDTLASVLVELDDSLICPTGQEEEMEGWNKRIIPSFHHFVFRARISHVRHMRVRIPFGASASVM